MTPTEKAIRDFCGHHADWWPSTTQVQEMLALAQPEQEPVLQDIEQYRLQMAGISTAAIGYWKETDSIHRDYDTVALRDVAKLYAKYDALYKAQPEQKPLAKVEPCAVCGEGKARLSVLRSCDTCHSEYAGQAEMKVALGKPEQEPSVTKTGCGILTLHSGFDDLPDGTKFYTTPPKRPWVGLTDAEMFELSEFRNAHGYVPTSAKRLFARIEAKLKEKNT